ncbi:MAG: c-type cytochrome [Chloroflexi bacterium]|nr:c-type cytochrome [Chloroflexota bacterium]
MGFEATVIIVVVLLLLLGGLLGYAARGGRATGPAQEVAGVVAMERKIAVTLGLLFAIGGLLTVYGFIFEPYRMEAKTQQQEDISIRRGIETYSSVCYTCHGIEGKGAVVPGSDPPVVTPQLNRVDLRPTDPDELRKRYDFVFKTIARGRPNTRMPSWSRQEGGVLLDEHINELTLMILHGDKEIEADGYAAPVWEHVKEKVQEKIAHGSPTPVPLPEKPSVALSPEAEKGLAIWKGEGGCIGCHAIAGMGGGQTGPGLSNIGNVAATRRPGMSAADYIRESILDPGAFVVQGFQPIMPSFKGRFSDEQLNQLVEFYLSLKQ